MQFQPANPPELADMSCQVDFPVPREVLKFNTTIQKLGDDAEDNYIIPGESKVPEDWIRRPILPPDAS